MLTELELKNNHADCLNLLDVFLKVCEENNITYYIAEGSAIGTVREKGFIPWDVNIDINMSIDEYEKLDAILSNMDLGDMCWEMPSHGRMLKWLVYKEPGNCAVRSNIDIGAFAAAPDSRILRYCEHLLLLWNYKAHKLKNSDVKRKFPYNILKKIAEPFPESFYFNNMDKLGRYSSIDKARYLIDLTPGGLCFGFHVPKKEWYYGEEKWGVFEGRRVRLPSDYHSYLTSLYGDYMTPVRVEKGVYHNTK